MQHKLRPRQETFSSAIRGMLPVFAWLSPFPASSQPCSFAVAAPVSSAVPEEVAAPLGRAPLERCWLSRPGGDADIIYNGNCCEPSGWLQLLEKIAPRL